jgi:hypothetical protein
MKKIVWCLCVFVAVVLMTPNALATKKVLMVQGAQFDSDMQSTKGWALLKYGNTGWVIREFKPWLYANPKNELRSTLINEGPWNAIWIVSHGCYLPGHGGFIDLESSGGGITLAIDSVAGWFRQSTTFAPDEVILHTCLLGEDPTLAVNFRNPRLLHAYSYKVVKILCPNWEFFRHWPPHGKGKPTIGSLPSQLSAEFRLSRLSAVSTECIGYGCCDGT